MKTHVLGVLASGRGSDFQSIVDHAKLNILQDVDLGVLITNNREAYAIERARQNGIPDVFIEGISRKKFPSPTIREREREIFDQKVMKVMKEYGVDIIALAGFMQILSPFFVDEYRYKIMNIHPAINIQKYGGPGMYGHHVHEAIIKAGEKESGCTIHYVTNDVDSGPIILQQTVPVKSHDNANTLSERILIYEHRIYAKAIQLHADCRLKVEGNSVEIDTSGDWDEKWRKRQDRYIHFQTNELLKNGKQIEDIL